MTAYEALRTDVAWLDLSARGLLRLTGEDRARLLHALSTNHIQDLPPGAGVYAFFLNEKGRVLADSYIYNLGESFLLDTEPETAVTLRDHLDRYIIADDVTVEDQTGNRSTIGLEGPASFERAASLGIPVPGRPFGIEPYDAGFVARVAATGPVGLRLWVSAAEKESLFANIPEATPQEARTVRLENALPRYGEDITSRFLVQETQLLHAIHFNKGCYLGQEIVERVRSRGQVHRLLTPVQLDGVAAPEPGTILTIEGKAAEITSAAYSPALGKVVALAYIRTDR